MSNNNNNLYEFGEFRLDTKERVLLRGKETIFLAPKVFDTLEFLVKENGKVVSKNDLLDEVWADSFVEESNLTQNIYVLRKTLGKEFIETVPRRGYRFVSKVKRHKDEDGFASDGADDASDYLIAERTKTSTYLHEEIIEEEDTPQDDSITTKVIPAVTNNQSRRTFGKSQVAIAFGVFTAVLIAIFGIFLWQRNSSTATDSALENIKLEILTDTGNIRNFAISPDGQLLAYIRKDNPDKGSVWINDITTKSAIPIDLPARFTPQAIEFSNDGKFIYFLHRPLNSKGADIYKTSRFGGDSEYIIGNVWSEMSVSPDGKKMAFYRIIGEKNQAQLVIYDLIDKSERVLITKDFPETFSRQTYPAWSADESKIYAIVRPQVQAISRLSEIDTKTGEENILKTPKFRQFRSVIALPNGNDLIVTAREAKKFPQVYRMNTTGGEIERLTNDLNTYRRTSISKDGKKLAILQKQTFSHIWKLPNASPENAIQLTFGKTRRHGRHGIDILPDGRIVFTAIDDLNRDVWTVDPKDGSKQQFTKDYSDINERPLVSGDGNYIYFQSAQGKTFDIKRVGINGGEIETVVKDETASLMFPNISSDGRTLYFIKRQKGESIIIKKDLPDGEEQEIKLPENFTVDSFLTLSPDERFLAFRQVNKQKRFTIEEEENSPIEVGIISLEENSNFKPKKLKIITTQSKFHWSDTSDAIYYIFHDVENSAIWKQQVFADVEPEKTIELKDTKIFHFKFSPTGDLVLSKGKHLDDVVLLTNFD